MPDDTNKNVYDTSKIVKVRRKCNFRRPNFVEGT